MSLQTTYTVRIRGGEIWQFKYNLKGILIGWATLEGELTDKQEKFLYLDGKFPWKEQHLQQWEKKYPPTQVEKNPPDLGFVNFWEKYQYKVKRELAEKAWNKLPDADKIRCHLNLKKYNQHLATTGQAKAHLVSWLNQKRFNDEY